MGRKPVLHMTVGIPGCGKSTWIQSQLTRTLIPAVTISTDVIRARLTGDASSQERNDAVFPTFHREIEEALRVGMAVYADATNLKASSRKVLHEIGIAVDVPMIAHWFGISSDLHACQERNLGRERQVPYNVMQKFHHQFLYDSTVATIVGEGWNVDIIDGQVPDAEDG